MSGETVARSPAAGKRLTAARCARIAATASGGTFDLPDYPARRRLETAGYVESGWCAGGARNRRVYRLTAKGRAHLARQRDESLQQGVHPVPVLR